MGAQPAAWPPTKRTGALSSSPTATSSRKPRPSFVYSEPEASGRHDDVGRAPAELLRDLEGDGLGALGVVGPQVDVQEGPALQLVGELQAEPVDLVVGSLDAHDGARRARAPGPPWRAPGRPG